MSNRRSDRNNLAIIGASGTGKTTLAVGLYATSTESFTVSPDGDETRKYLEIRKTSIEEGFWPEASLESVNFDIRLRLHASGNQTEIVFREYMGERMERDPNYIRAVIGTPKAALILFNPGMPGLSNPEARNRMLGNLKGIAQHLKDNGCIAVAFVVTASDRLISDLAAFREDFESYASEVTNHLKNLGLKWKRFDVTVSGQLDDQNKPKLARGENNTTHEPFLWLLKRIRDYKRRKYLLTAVAVVAIFLGLSGVLFGGLVIHSRQVLTRAETAFATTTNALNMAYAARNEAEVRTKSEFFETNRFDEIRAILPSDRTRKQELIARAMEQKDLWGVRLLRMEFTSNRNKIATRPLNVELTWFNDFNKQLTASEPTFRDAVIEHDTLTNEWTQSRSSLETNCQTEHFRANVEQERKNLSAKPDAPREPLLNSKKLIADEEKKYTLVTNRTELCVRLGLMTARTNAVVRFVDSKMGKPEDTTPPGDTMALCQRISKELKSVLTSEEFNELEDVIAKRRSAARIAWEKHHFPLRVQAQIDELRAVSDAPANVLRNSRVFFEGLDKQFPSIPEDNRSLAKKKITDERTAAISRYLKIKTPWRPEDEERPIGTSVLQDRVRQELQSALLDAEFESLWAGLENRCDEACRAWDAYHFPRRVTELKDALNGAGSNPSRSLADSLAFLSAMTNNYPTISQVKFIEARHSIEETRRKTIGAYAESISRSWASKGRESPKFDIGEIRNTILNQRAVTDEEYQTFETIMNERYSKAQQEWNKKQKELVDTFDLNSDIETVVSKYDEFLDDWPNNPYRANLDDKVDNLLCNFFNTYIASYDQDFRGSKRIYSELIPKARIQQAERKYNKFRNVLNKRVLREGPLSKRRSGRFAQLCLKDDKTDQFDRAFPQTLKIRKIEVKVDTTSRDSDWSRLILGCNFISQRWNLNSGSMESVFERYAFSGEELRRGSFDNGWIPVRTTELEVPTNPFTYTFFKFYYKEKMEDRTSIDQDDIQYLLLDFTGGTQTPEYSWNFCFKHSGFDYNNAGVLHVRITFEGIGDDFKSLWEKSKN